MDDALQRLTAFGRELRAAGLRIGADSIVDLAEAASLLDAEDLYWAGRLTLVSSPAEVSVYDRVFRAHFGPRQPVMLVTPATRLRAAPSGDDEDAPETGSGGTDAKTRASATELLRHKSFASCTREELDRLIPLMRRLQLVVPPQRTHRRRRARRGDLDVRRTIRRALRTDGEPVRLAHRAHTLRQRRVVLFLDVSGSMSAYSRALALFAHVSLRTERRWEAFCFGTRVTRATRALHSPEPDEALDRLAGEVLDWDGGTRIGESLLALLDRYGSVVRGSVFVICSDGLDVGDAEVLSRSMQRLGRLAYRVAWLNPLMEDPGYQPLARGMAAALPYVDLFAAGHSVASLEGTVDELRRLWAPSAQPALARRVEARTRIRTGTVTRVSAGSRPSTSSTSIFRARRPTSASLSDSAVSDGSVCREASLSDPAASMTRSGIPMPRVLAASRTPSATRSAVA
jgi:uncharacterized protein with von Willebrand factor type A (vWA) domain